MQQGQKTAGTMGTDCRKEKLIALFGQLFRALFQKQKLRLIVFLVGNTFLRAGKSLRKIGDMRARNRRALARGVLRRPIDAERGGLRFAQRREGHFFAQISGALIERLTVRIYSADCRQRGSRAENQAMIDFDNLLPHGKKLGGRLQKIEILQHAALQTVFDGYGRSVRMPRFHRFENFGEIAERDTFVAFEGFFFFSGSALRFEERLRRQMGIAAFRPEISDFHKFFSFIPFPQYRESIFRYLPTQDRGR